MHPSPSSHSKASQSRRVELADTQFETQPAANASLSENLEKLESLARDIGAVSVKVMVAETQIFLIAQFDRLEFSEPHINHSTERQFNQPPQRR